MVIEWFYNYLKLKAAILVTGKYIFTADVVKLEYLFPIVAPSRCKK